MIEVREIGDGSPEEWDAYLATHDGALIYASSVFRKLLVELLECRDRSLMALEGGAIRGVLPLLELDTPAGRVVNSLPYYGSNGGTLADVGAAVLLAARYDELALEPGVVSATIVENPFVEGSLPTVVSTHADERIAQWTDLPATGIEASARRNVRKAQEAGYRVDVDAGALPALHELHDAGMRAIGGRPKQRRFFDLVGSRLEAGKDFDVYVARRGHVVGAALLVLYFHWTVEYYVPATALDQRSLQPLALLLDRAMSDAAERGFTRWNWGGTWSSQAGVYRFKEKWGASETTYRYATQVNDDSLLARSAEELTTQFPGFFVLPFDALEPEGVANA